MSHSAREESLFHSHLQEAPAEKASSDEEKPRTQHTDVKLEAAGLMNNPHTQAAVHPYVVQDLRDASSVDLYNWIESVLGVSRERIETWASQIGKQKWFDDELIQEYLQDYCDAPKEEQRYKPFCELAGRIIEFAREKLTDTDLINPVQFIDTSSIPVERIPEQGSLGAQRKLDITMTYEAAAQVFLNTQKITWRDVLHFIELKRSANIAALLAKEKERRAKSCTPVQSTIGQKSPAEDTENRQFVDDVPTGTKRSRTSTDDLNTGGSSNKICRRGKSIPKQKEGAEQAGSYALEVLACTYGTRLFCHSTLLLDDKLSLYYYDACGIIHTNQHLSLIQDFEKTAAVFIALACCSLEQLGVMPTSIIKSPTPYAVTNPPHKLNGHYFTFDHPISAQTIKVTLDKPLYTQYVCSGRRTFTYTIKAVPELSKKSLMMKFSYQVVTRRPEYELVDIARKAGVGHLPDVHAWANLYKMSEGVRQFFKLITDEERKCQEDRTLRMIVYTEYQCIQPLFARRCDLIPVMVEQMITCLHDLRYKADMLHRDISVNNVMVHMLGDKYHFILNDFDMGVVLPKDENSPHLPSSKNRTGTYAFMAVALLEDAEFFKTMSKYKPIRHLLCHDFESLFWVSLWCVITLFLHELPPDQRERFVGIAMRWETEHALDTKQAMYSFPVTKKLTSLPPSARCLQAWFNGWTRLFLKVTTAETEHTIDSPSEPFDAETLGGTFTKDTILAALTPLMPFRQADIEENESNEDVEENELDVEENGQEAEKERDAEQRGQDAEDDLRREDERPDAERKQQGTEPAGTEGRMDRDAKEGKVVEKQQVTETKVQGEGRKASEGEEPDNGSVDEGGAHGRKEPCPCKAS